jgi:hypothetical protein
LAFQDSVAAVSRIRNDMGNVRTPPKVKLFVGVLTALSELMPEVHQRLAERFGAADMISDPYPFDLTNYYDEEMGTPILRRFAAFEELIAPDRIPAIKHATNELESDLAAKFGQAVRPANLDPGYLEESKIVLASTKNFYHRILLAQGIYGEVTLHYRQGRWEAFPWSFPDFRSGRYDRFFMDLRRRYREQLRTEGGEKNKGTCPHRT